MHDQTDELRAAHDQVEQLVQAIVDIGSDLDLDGTLHRFVKAAMTLTGARIGALGVRGADGSLSTFVHSGIDGDLGRLLGGLPVGEGLRIDDLHAHPQGVEDGPVRALLAIPITVRADDFGVLYLADDRPGRAFSDAEAGTGRALCSA